MRPTPFQLLRRAAQVVALALVPGAGLATEPATHGSQILVREVRSAAIEDVRLALEDAIAAEGIGPPTLSHFGEMLSRTAADLGHPPRLYAAAVIYTFCSAPTAAGLVRESPHNIALCPLSIAAYEVPARPGTVFLSYRRSAESAGGRAADALMEQIVVRTAEQFEDAAASARPAPAK